MRKNGFDLAKHGLNLKIWFKTKFGLILGTKKKKKVNEERRRGEEEEEEEEEKRRDFKARGVQASQGMELLTLSMELGFLVWIYEILRLCMGNGLSQKLGF